ncbi:MAG: Rpn family recombination-promoting nuclease/putative transposase [Lachnospiraceae bacterium]|nr:Rpn family recombination-promoting nuclease/putative transposase [Lachnospiraceae bacterium]
MANKNEYLEEAYNTLLELSADEKKRLEYEAREKAIRDYNSNISYARQEGEQIGEKRGEARGIKKKERELILNWTRKGREVSEMAVLLELSESEVRQVQAENREQEGTE